MKIKNITCLFVLFISLSAYSQNPDLSLIPYRSGDLWGYASPDKSIVIKPIYEEADMFYEGLAVVKKGGKYGYINKDGKVVIPIKYFSAKPFRYGYFIKAGQENAAAGELNEQKTVLFAGAAAQSNGYEICIDPKGKVMPKCPAIPDASATDINKPNTVTVVRNYSTVQKTDLYDKIIDDYKMMGADQTYYIATRGGNFGVFNNTFDVIVPFEYSKIEKVDIGAMTYLMAEKDGLKGMLFGNGSPYLAVENSKLNHVTGKDGNNYFVFTSSHKSGVKNTRYQNMVEGDFKDVAFDGHNGFVLTGQDGMKGYYFINGGTIEPKYAEVKPVPGSDYVMVKSAAGKWGFVNKSLIEFFAE